MKRIAAHATYDWGVPLLAFSKLCGKPSDKKEGGDLNEFK